MVSPSEYRAMMDSTPAMEKYHRSASEIAAARGLVPQGHIGGVKRSGALTIHLLTPALFKKRGK